MIFAVSPLVFRFENISLLFALAFVPLMLAMFFSVVRWKKKTTARIGDPKLVEQLIRGYSSARFRNKFLLVLAAFVLCALGLANLQSPIGAERVNRQGVDVMVALDVSKSMLATDIQPDRLQRAKLLVSQLINQLGNNRVGLVLFAGRAYLQMPMTTDLTAARIYLNTASTHSVPTQGTVIAEALTICNNAFDPNQKKYKTVVLISDGEDHDKQAGEVAGKMAEEGVVIHTVGVGTTAGSQLIDPDTREIKRNTDGTPVLSKLNEQALMDLASAGKGSYQLLVETGGAADKIIAQINSMEKKNITDNSILRYRSHFQWFIALGLLLLVVELLMPERKEPTL